MALSLRVSRSGEGSGVGDICGEVVKMGEMSGNLGEMGENGWEFGWNG